MIRPTQSYPRGGFEPSRLATIVLLTLWVLLFALSGCNSGDRTLTEVDPEAVPESPDFEQVRAILEHDCVPCHKGGKPGAQPLDAAVDRAELLREDEPGKSPAFRENDPDYDTCEGILAGFGDVLRVVNDETMPPGSWPRLEEWEKQLLFNWFINSDACSPCSEPCP